MLLRKKVHFERYRSFLIYDFSRTCAARIKRATEGHMKLTIA
jgi:hypothetical protein